MLFVAPTALRPSFTPAHLPHSSLTPLSPSIFSPHPARLHIHPTFRTAVVNTANFDARAVDASQPPFNPPALPKLSPRAAGRLTLLVVPMLWASYSIVIKILQVLPWAFGPAAFNAIRLLMCFPVLFPVLLRHARDRWRQHRANATPLLDVTALGGLELGFWTCAVNTLQLVGLQFTSASRGAFLTQLCTVIVPFAAVLSGAEAQLGRSVITASLMSVCGVGLLTLDDVASPFLWRGDGLLLISAFVSTMYVLRSKYFSERAEPGPLVAMKVVSQALCALVYWGIINMKRLSTVGLSTAISSAMTGAKLWTLGLNVFLMLFTGLGLSVGSTVMQMRGQKNVSASEAVIIFTSTPLWTSLMAIPLGERFGIRGIIGAFLIFVATLLCSSEKKDAKAET